MLVSRNVTIAGRRTSIRLEPEMWDSLGEIARREKLSIHQIATLVDGFRRSSSLTAKLRVFIVGYYRAAATEAGHLTAGHGTVLPGARPSRLSDPPASGNSLHDSVRARIAMLSRDGIEGPSVRRRRLTLS